MLSERGLLRIISMAYKQEVDLVLLVGLELQ